MMKKMLADSPSLNENKTLEYTVSIWICCYFVKAFTPTQLGVGQNPWLPCLFNDDLPASKGSASTSPTLEKHLNVIANARKAFSQAETSRKLHEVLKYFHIKTMFLNKEIIYLINYHRKNDGKDQSQLSELVVNL